MKQVCISFSGGRTSAFMTLELLKDEQHSDESIRAMKQSEYLVGKISRLIKEIQKP